MKKTFVILIFLGQFLFGQKTPISFVNYEMNKENTQDDFFEWDDRISEIILKNDTDFVFWSRPLTNSCSTWSGYNGTWEKDNDTIIFSDQYEIMQRDAQFEFSNKNRQQYYHLEFKTDKREKLTQKNIKIQIIYDYNSGLKDIDLTMELANDFSIKIPYKDIPNRKNLASLRYEYFLPNGEKRYGYITENKTVNIKEKALPNFISITFIEQPKKEMIYRTTKGLLGEDKIKIISTNKTKSSLYDYTDDLKFKDDYKKQSAK